MITGLLVIAFLSAWWQAICCADRGVSADWFFSALAGAVCTTLVLLVTVFGT